MLILLRLMKKLKTTVLILSIMLLFAELSPISVPIGLYSVSPVMAAESTDTVFYGDTNAEAVLGNIKYSDINGNIWSKDAIYETGALGIIKGYDEINKRFSRNVPLTKEEAIAIAYRAAGREAEAQQLGVLMNNARPAGNRKTDPLEVWYDGYLQLAANEGLISARNLADAFNADQTTLTSDSFKRKSAAQRQEFAYWLARALNIPPAVQQQELLNYSDWRSVDPDKLQYIEALLQQGVITGTSGRINPAASVTREQGAQIVKNAESPVLLAHGLLKYAGIVENIADTKDYTGTVAVTGKNITVTNADGVAVSIKTLNQATSSQDAKNENAGNPLTGSKRELVVNKNGNIGNSSLLQTGDRIQYIVDSSNVVKYVYVISNITDVRYLAVQVSGVDRTNLLLNVIQLFEMDYPDISSISGDNPLDWSKNEKAAFRISPVAPVTINGVSSSLSGVTDDATAILTLDSNNLVKEIQCVDFGINNEARKIVRGIVEENNPDLGYLTIYNEDGSGTGGGSSAVLRTYNYIDQNTTEIYRNHKLSTADSIKSGDTAYIRLDNDGDIASISAMDNYINKYGKVISKLPAEIVVEYEDGTQQILTAGKNTIVIRDKLVVGMKALQDGDRVRLLLNESNKTTEIKEITIEGDEHYISNIYKGTITKIDDISDKISVMGMQVFDRGDWERTEWKGLTAIPIAEGFKIYSGDSVIDIEDANRLLYSNEAYIAVEKTYGGEERAVVLTYRNSLDTPVPAGSDIISGAVSGSGSFVLSRENKRVIYSDGSIVVKNGRLASGNSLSNNDAAYFALDRDYSNGDYYASVIKVDEQQAANGLTIYRGRISEINDGKNFTVESFSQLQNLEWKYSNTPKTLNITFDTRILIEDGILNVRDFVGYGEESYLRRTVYVVADGTNAILVSTAPYGIENLKGTVYAINGDQISLRKVSIYDASAYMWTNRSDAVINLLDNTVVIKNGKISNTAGIEKGDAVRVLKKDTSTAGEGYIIFVE